MAITTVTFMDFINILTSIICTLRIRNVVAAKPYVRAHVRGEFNCRRKIFRGISASAAKQ